MRHGFASWRFLCAALLLLSGCADKLLVTSEPSGAMVSVVDDRGRLVVAGPSPLMAELSLPEDSDTAYAIEVQPTTLQAERFLPASRTLNAADYFQLPGGEDGVPVLAFTLTEKDYVNLPQVEVMLTPRGRWVGVLTRGRSYKDVTEGGGAVPALVVDFGDNRGLQGFAISPDGERIVYAEAVYDRAVALPGGPMSVETPRVFNLKGANLRGINIVGGGVQHITTEDFRDLFPTFSADGERILFSSNRRGELAGILGIRANGRSGISDIYVNHRNGMVVQPTAAADGTIAFAVVTLDPSQQNVTDTQVWTHYGPNEFPTQITRGRSPAVAPDGSAIAYINPDDGNLWVVDPDGSNRVQLTSGATDVVRRYRAALEPTERQLFDEDRAADRLAVAPFRDPSWSPDGRWVLYTAMEGSDPTGRPNEDIWMIRPDGTDKQQLTTNGSADRHPLMAPDGRSVYFLSNRGESWGIWRIPFGDVD
ncbi:MAG: hypothetical protein AAF710_02055 [Planctomycetota bacterium]